MIKPTCSKCEKPLGPTRIGKYRYCNLCHAANMRAKRPKHSELTNEEKKKLNCRSHTKMLLRRGTIVKLPCKCGSVKVEAHHTDYNNPRLVTWLCRPCHMKEHKREKWYQMNLSTDFLLEQALEF